MIDYPEDDRLRAQAAKHGLQPPVLIRDIVRVVELLNLRAKRFFNKRSVLSGSMDEVQWQKLVYLHVHRAAYSQKDLRRIVQETLAPGLRSSQPR